MKTSLGLMCALAMAAVVSIGAQQPARPANPPRTPAATGQKPAPPRPAAAAPKTGQQTAGQAFKNVQVLKDVPVDDFLPLMGLMTAAVGGDCATCHTNAGTDFAAWHADPPLKKKAREMSAMVMAINKTHFGGRAVVTCWTCHRGRSTPVQSPTMDHVYGSLDFVPDDLVYTSTPGQPRPGDVIDKFIQAIGGAAKVNAITSYEATGTALGFRGFGGGGDVRVFARKPDQRSMIISYKVAGRDATVRSFDGKVGWTKTPINILGEYQLWGSELDGARLDAQMTFPGQIKTSLSRLRTVDAAEIDGKEMVVVQGNGTRDVFATLYFDKATSLLRRVVRFGPSPIGRIFTQFDYEDYRDVNGVKFPFKFEYVWLDGRDGIQLTDIKLNGPIDPRVFGRAADVEQALKK